MNLQDRIYKATEYGINSVKAIKEAREEYENHIYDGESILELIINIHETYLKILKGEQNEKKKKEKRI